MPLPKEKEEAYWDAMQLIVEMIRELLKDEAQSVDGADCAQ